MITLKQMLPAALHKSLELALEKGRSICLVDNPSNQVAWVFPSTDKHSEIHSVFTMDGSQLAPFTMTHAFSCSKGAFPSIRHDQIRDMTAQLLSEVCPNVEVESALQPITGETFPYRIANVGDNTRLDVKAQGF